MKDSRAAQRAQVLELLQSRAGNWVPLPTILSLGFAQFGARILELRRSGYRILNKTEHRDGKVLSWYKLVESDADERPKQSAASPASQSALFSQAELERIARWEDWG